MGWHAIVAAADESAVVDSRPWREQTECEPSRAGPGEATPLRKCCTPGPCPQPNDV